MSRSELLSEVASLDTESVDDPIDNLPDLQNVLMEQMLNSSEVQGIKDLLEKQLQWKHQEELREHVLRQETEMSELQGQLKSADVSFAISAGNFTNMSLPSSEPVTPIQCSLSEVHEMNAMYDDFVGANVSDLPLSPELSPLVVGICMSDECERTLSPAEQDFIHQLHGFSLDNEESAATLPTTVSNNDDVLSCQYAISNSLRQKNVKSSQNEFRKGNFPSHVYLPNNRSRRINTQSLRTGTFNKWKDFFKTAICSKWQELGSCPYGEKCRFAHGLRELRKRPLGHKKFNHVTCKKFLEGCCPYGSRCRFSHGVYEQRMSGRQTGVFSGRNQSPDWTGRYGYKYGDYLHRTMEGNDMNRHWGIQKGDNVRGHVTYNHENTFIY